MPESMNTKMQRSYVQMEGAALFCVQTQAVVSKQILAALWTHSVRFNAMLKSHAGFQELSVQMMPNAISNVMVAQHAH